MGFQGLPDLNETGTRYQHYSELIDIFNSGIEIINTMSPKLVNDADRNKVVELEHAVARINARIDVLSRYQTKQADMRRLIEFELPKLPKSKPAEGETEGKTCQA